MYMTRCSLSFEQIYGYIFSDDEDVVRLVAKVMPLVASFQVRSCTSPRSVLLIYSSLQVADGLAGSCGGVLRGQGKLATHLGS